MFLRDLWPRGCLPSEDVEISSFPGRFCDVYGIPRSFRSRAIGCNPTRFLVRIMVDVLNFPRATLEDMAQIVSTCRERKRSRTELGSCS